MTENSGSDRAADLLVNGWIAPHDLEALDIFLGNIRHSEAHEAASVIITHTRLDANDADVTLLNGILDSLVGIRVSISGLSSHDCQNTDDLDAVSRRALVSPEAVDSQHERARHFTGRDLLWRLLKLHRLLVDVLALIGVEAVSAESTLGGRVLAEAWRRELGKSERHIDNLVDAALHALEDGFARANR
jgi:hypothetical protein